jgi:hypothetical protein
VTNAHAGLSGDGEGIRDLGADVHTRFQGLSAFYRAPEAEQLLATTARCATAPMTSRTTNRGGRDAAGLTLLDGVTQQTAELESTNAATATEWSLRGSDANRCVAVVGIMGL